MSNIINLVEKVKKKSENWDKPIKVVALAMLQDAIEKDESWGDYTEEEKNAVILLVNKLQIEIGKEQEN